MQTTTTVKKVENLHHPAMTMGISVAYAAVRRRYLL